MDRMASSAHFFVSGITIWKQIADDLQRRIRQQEWPAAGKLPSEAVLAAHYGVNRHTVRQALQDLADRGLIDIRHGTGSFVASQVFDYELIERPRFSEWVKRYNKPARKQILQAEILAFDALPERERILRYGVFPPVSQVAMVKALSFVGEEPVSLARHLFFGENLLGLIGHLQSGMGITASLRLNGVSDYTRYRSTITMALPQAEDRQLLRMTSGECLFVCENVNVDPAGRGIEFSIVRYPGSRVRMVYEPG